MSANAVEIPLARGGFLLPVFFEAAEGLRLESRVAVSVRLLPGSEHGAGVVRAVLRQAGKVSAVAWRLYLAFCFEWNRIAYKGRVPHRPLAAVLLLGAVRGRGARAVPAVHGEAGSGPMPGCCLPGRIRAKSQSMRARKGPSNAGPPSSDTRGAIGPIGRSGSGTIEAD